MAEVVFGFDREIGGWVADQLGYDGFAGNFVNAIGVLENNRIIGGTVFHNYYPNEGVVEMTSASIESRWLTRPMIRAIFTFAFGYLQCQMTVMRVSEINTRMVNVAKRFGCKGYLIPRLRGKNEGEWIFCFTDDDWLKSPYRKAS